MKQDKAMELASFNMETLKRLGAQADVNSLSGESLLCQLAANGARELYLKKKILELGAKDLTMAKVKSVMRTYELVNSVLKQDSKAGSVRKKTHCWRCGDKTPLRNEYGVSPDKVKCIFCKTNGSHNTKTCPKKKRSDKDKKPEQPQRNSDGEENKKTQSKKVKVKERDQKMSRRRRKRRHMQLRMEQGVIVIVHLLLTELICICLVLLTE